jgi:hypothetical protein
MNPNVPSSSKRPRTTEADNIIPALINNTWTKKISNKLAWKYACIEASIMNNKEKLFKLETALNNNEMIPASILKHASKLSNNEEFIIKQAKLFIEQRIVQLTTSTDLLNTEFNNFSNIFSSEINLYARIGHFNLTDESIKLLFDECEFQRRDFLVNMKLKQTNFEQKKLTKSTKLNEIKLKNQQPAVITQGQFNNLTKKLNNLQLKLSKNSQESGKQQKKPSSKTQQKGSSQNNTQQTRTPKKKRNSQKTTKGGNGKSKNTLRK